MKFKDVAHHYLGCEVMAKRKNDTEFSKGIIVEVTKGSNHGDWVYVRFEDIVESVSNTWEVSKSTAHHYFLCEDSIKPILRKLQDMTEEDAKGIGYDSAFFFRDTVRIVHNGRFTNTTFTGKEFHYLCQRGYDLFGLIDSGEAIDYKTVIK